MSRDLSRLGLSYTLRPWISRACLCPWKYRNLQCAKHVYELTNVNQLWPDLGKVYQKKKGGALENDTVSTREEDVYEPLYSLIPAL